MDYSIGDIIKVKDYKELEEHLRKAKLKNNTIFFTIYTDPQGFINAVVMGRKI